MRFTNSNAREKDMFYFSAVGTGENDELHPLPLACGT